MSTTPHTLDTNEIQSLVPGDIALERELQVGDVILSRSTNNIYTILGELPGIPSDGITRILIIHSSRYGNIYKHEIPRCRDPNYPLVSDGIYADWGWEKVVQNPVG